MGGGIVNIGDDHVGHSEATISVPVINSTRHASSCCPEAAPHLDPRVVHCGRKVQRERRQNRKTRCKRHES